MYIHTYRAAPDDEQVYHRKRAVPGWWLHADLIDLTQDTRATKATNRPLFVYIAYSCLLRAAVYDAKGEHVKAFELLRANADLSWVKEQDPDTLHWIGLFQHWMKINTYVNRLMSGDVSVLPDYVE